MTGKPTGVVQLLTGATPVSRLLIIGVICGVLALVPLPVLDSLPQFCLWERLFGCCPAHGTTHALAALLHGDLRRALAYNVNVVVVAPVLLFVAARDVYQLLRRK